MSISSGTNTFNSSASSATSPSSECDSELVEFKMQSDCPGAAKKRKEDNGESITCHQGINSVKNITTSNSNDYIKHEFNTQPTIISNSGRLNNSFNKSQHSPDMTNRQIPASKIGSNEQQAIRSTNHNQTPAILANQAAMVKVELTKISKVHRIESTVPSSNNSTNQNQFIGYKTRPLLINHPSTSSSPSSTPSFSTPSTSVVDKNQASANQNPKSSDISKVGSQQLQTATIIPTVSSQLILSSLITTQAKPSVASLNSQSDLHNNNKNNNNLSTYNNHQSTLDSREAPKTITSKSTTISSSSTTTTTTTTTTSKIQAQETKPVVKQQRHSVSPSSLNQSSSTSSSAAPGSAGNAAAARLIDMGKRLLEATREGQVEHVRHLVVNSGAPFTSDSFGTTALHIAAQNGSFEIAEILLRGGVNKDARTKLERTALHLAAQSGSLDIADLLLKHGVDVNARDMLKMTPLHWAVQRNHLNVIERLLIAGADVTLRSKFQLTPIDIARDSELYDVVNLFKNWTNGQVAVLDENIEKTFNNIESNCSTESHEDLFDIDYQLAALVDANTSSPGDPMLDIDDHGIDLVELEWNNLDFGPDFFFTNDSEDAPNVEYLMKMVEELQKENKQLRQRVERLSTTNR